MSSPSRDERRPTKTPSRAVPGWLLLVLFILLAVHLLALVTTGVTIGLMRAVSDFAVRVRLHDLTLAPTFRLASFTAGLVLVLAYLWPVVRFLQSPNGAPPSPTVERRAVGGPLAIALIGFAPYLISVFYFPLATLYRFGRWSPELMSQQVLSPLVNGFLATTTAYLLTDWLFRARVIPRVFPAGRDIDVVRALTLRVRARLLVFLVAVAFTPLFTVLGLVRAARTRVDAGLPVGTVLATLTSASELTFFVYVALGVALTLLLARTLTAPLAEMVRALRRVGSGDLEVNLQVTSNDEVGALAAGVNAMAAALREKERVVTAFGRVVEPAVRDRLLAGNLQLGGEVRVASILFCDLRGFTAFAERTAPTEVVATLNQFFSTMTAWSRECGGSVDKFIGDALLVVFGLFSADPTAAYAAGAEAALRCGIGMNDRVRELNGVRRAASQPPLDVSIGIHSGEVLAGTIGAHDRHEYTVIGDTVNVASRLQQLCKSQGHRLLVSETTYELARSVGFGHDLTLLDSVQLRGRAQPVRVFGVPS